MGHQKEKETLHVYTFNKGENSGESLVLITKMLDNGDKKGLSSLIINQELTLNSYCNSASFNLITGALTPTKLRELANELESAMIRASVTE